MTVKVKAAIRRTQPLNADANAVFPLLSPAEAGRFFPRVQQITDLGNGAYHWLLKPMGTQKYQHQVEYASVWEVDDAQHRVLWRPVPDQGNARISGAWQIEPGRHGGIKLSLEIRAELKLDLPRWMQLVAEPIVQTEFQKLLNTYFDNVVAFSKSDAKRMNG